MGQKTAIEWTDHTFNPWWGCVKVSAACTHCYAETLAARWRFKWGTTQTPRAFGDKHWNEPLAWNRKAVADGVRRRVFCASMADVFELRDNEHGATLDTLRERLWTLIEATPGLDWQLLTKRPQNIQAMVPPRWLSAWPAHVWVGCTVENQAAADKRIPHLLSVPARVRFLSCEPLLGPVDLTAWIGRNTWLNSRLINCDEHTVVGEDDACNGCPNGGTECAGRWDRGLHQVIAGGESGPKARPTHPDWLRQLRDQCAEAGVAYMFKQFGAWAPMDIDRGGVVRLVDTDGTVRAGGKQGSAVAMSRCGKKAAGRTLDGRTHDEFPETD